MPPSRARFRRFSSCLLPLPLSVGPLHLFPVGIPPPDQQQRQRQRATMTMTPGPVGKQVLIPPKEDHVGTAKNSHRSPTASKRVKAWRDLISRNRYVLINWSNPLDWIGKDRISGQNVYPLMYLRSCRSCMRSYEQKPPMGNRPDTLPR